MTNVENIPTGENNPVFFMHKGAVNPWAPKLALKLSDKTDGIYFMLKNLLICEKIKIPARAP